MIAKQVFFAYIQDWHNVLISEIVFFKGLCIRK